MRLPTATLVTACALSAVFLTAGCGREDGEMRPGGEGSLQPSVAQGPTAFTGFTATPPATTPSAVAPTPAVPTPAVRTPVVPSTVVPSAVDPWSFVPSAVEPPIDSVVPPDTTRFGSAADPGAAAGEIGSENAPDVSGLTGVEEMGPAAVPEIPDLPDGGGLIPDLPDASGTTDGVTGSAGDSIFDSPTDVFTG